MVRTPLLALLLLCVSIPALALETIRVSVDKQTLPSGESLLLTVLADDRLPASAIDLGPLFRKFAVGEIRFNESSDSGKRYSEWQIPLLPRTDGEITIPSILVSGVATSPLSIRVTSSSLHQPKRRPLLEVSLNAEQLYAKQAAVYTLKLRLPSGVQIDSLSPPQLEKGNLRQLGDDKVLNETISGRKVKSLLRYYAINSDEPGPKTIKGPLLQGLLQERGVTKPFLEQAPDLTLNILATPVDAHYLPSKEVRLEETIEPDAPPYKIGEPIIRQIRLYARGIMKEQLPDIPLPKQTGLRSYDDGSSVQERVENGEVYVEKTIRQALIPQKPGTLPLPAIAIPWWNASTYTLTQAKISGHSLQVLATLNRDNPEEELVSGMQSSSHTLQWILFGVALLFITGLSIWLWRLRHRLVRPRTFRFIDDRLSWRRLNKALRSNDATAVHKALLHWAQQRWPELAPSCIEALPCYTELGSELDLLLAACYSDELTTPWNAKPLRRALRQWREAQIQSQQGDNPHGLL